jgi:membrane associated rhomboid family serine protease
MLPVKDNIPRERFPLVTGTVIAIVAVNYLLVGDHAGFLPFLLDLLLFGLLGPSVENALGRARFCVLCAIGASLGVATRAIADAGSPSTAVFCASGVTAAVLGGYLLRHPRGRVLTLVPVPLYTTLVEVPAVLLIGLWVALQVCFGVAGLG